MASLWTQLLFLHGHIADPVLARQLAKLPASSGSDPTGPGRPVAPRAPGRPNPLAFTQTGRMLVGPPQRK